MTRYTRQEAKTLGLPTCYGSTCQKHPLLDGLRRVSGACVECSKTNLRNSRTANPERTKIQQKKDGLKLRQNPVFVVKKLAVDAAYRAANKAQCRATIEVWSKRNPEKVKAYAKKTKALNSGRVLAHTVKRRLAKIKRTPSWLSNDDHWMIGQAYELAALRTKTFGFSWHVDHILPLQGKTVSGLHTPYNLQVIPGADNVRKSNSFEVAV
ncbi:hypothetical protein UFOVP654_23 [uncultured Caudovirales phage]|uniref:HNHc domain containing protein n=1 Tax=uncultured Caudovirales phage TaxID=2100421 RepID=A0A6J5N7G8_9CAUD|nr:hypothetical protein UFOVP654_23 [uncultured Caudovirales phage]